MDYIFIGLAALLGSAITLFSGFGLGTILLPIFGLFFPIEIAIVMTSIVHFANNILKMLLFGRKSSKNVAVKFGIPAVIFGFIGAYCLKLLLQTQPVFSYHLFDKIITVYLIKITVGFLLLCFSVIEFVPAIKNTTFNKKWLPLGGVLSGFFGGLSGHQGALRSAFLIKSGLSKSSFIATGVVIACMVDVSRLSIYLFDLKNTTTHLNYKLILFAVLLAFSGVYIGTKYLQKTTFKLVQNTVAVFLLLYAILLIIGII